MHIVKLLDGGQAKIFRALRLEALKSHPEAFGSSYEAEAGEPLADVETRLSRGGTFGGFLGEALTGVAIFSSFGAARLRHKGMLGGMFVRENARGSGLANAIVEAVVDHARTRVELIQLSVAVTNRRAIRFYERHGFSIYATEPSALKLEDGYIDEHLMVRFLSMPAARR